MLLFNKWKTYHCKKCIFVSIHLMLLFNPTLVPNINVVIAVSIHLMLLFNLYIGGGSKTANMFQYISCCCLTAQHFLTNEFEDMFQYISCCCLTVFSVSVSVILSRVSIHLMLLFNKLMAGQEIW